MNVLSLFDGISCGRIALERANIPIDNYYASEICKDAIQVSKLNYPDIIQIGDVTKIDTSLLPKIDLLIGGSPCQGFSMAGKQLNFDDPRSKLFFEYVRIYRDLKPTYFLLENVNMKKQWQNIISEQLECQPILINSSNFSKQHRKRLYWTNIPISDIPTLPNLDYNKYIYINSVTAILKLKYTLQINILHCWHRPPGVNIESSEILTL